MVSVITGFSGHFNVASGFLKSHLADNAFYCNKMHFIEFDLMDDGGWCGKDFSRSVRRVAGSSAKMIAIKKSVDALQPGRYDRLPLACRLFAENVAPPSSLSSRRRRWRRSSSSAATPIFRSTRRASCCRTSLAARRWSTWPVCATRWPRRAATSRTINPVVPAQLVIDHSLNVEFAGTDTEALSKNMAVEASGATPSASSSWPGAQKAFDNVNVVMQGNAKRRYDRKVSTYCV